jgi:GTPase
MEIIYNSIFNHNDNNFKPEIEEGNIEYKWRLDKKDINGLKKLVSQMLWRLNEGYELTNNYEAHYLLGVYDSGDLGRLTENELLDSKTIFETVLIKAKAEIIKEKIININESYIAFLTIRKIPENKKLNEFNVIFIGSSGTGKTTIIGNLCYENNDLNPIYRNSILQHPHEKVMGKTMSIKKDIIGIKNLSLITYNYSSNWGEISAISDSIINLYDTPGSNLKSIIYCLSSINHDLIILYDDLSSFSNFVKFYASICGIDIYSTMKDQINYDDIRKKLLNIKRKINPINEKINPINEKINPSMFRITTLYSIPDNNNITAGIQVSGSIQRNTKYKLIGSYENLFEIPVKILTIHKKNLNSMQIEEGESGALSLEVSNKIKLNKNMIIVPETLQIKYFYNSIEIKILFGGKKSLSDYFLAYSDYFLAYSGNFVFRSQLIWSVNEKIKNILKFDKKIYLQNSIIILIPINIPPNDRLEDYIIIVETMLK